MQDLPGRRPARMAGAAIGLFVLAVFVGRLLLAGGAAWALLAVLLPLILLALGVGLGFRAAFAMVAAFMALVLAVRWFLQESPSGWIALLLVPVVALTAIVVGRVLGKLRQPPAAATGPSDDGRP